MRSKSKDLFEVQALK